MSEFANWNYPTAVRLGAGRIAELAGACRELSCSAPLLVTDPGLADSSMVAAALSSCQQAGLSVNEPSICSGVGWLVTNQNVDGSWNLGVPGVHPYVRIVGFEGEDEP